MKRHFLSGLLVVGGLCLSGLRAQAQEKPTLNSAPPGPPATPPRPTTPVPATPAPAAPTPAPAPMPDPAVRPTPDSPSGLDFPGRDPGKDGTTSDPTYTKKFIYSNFGLGFSSSGGLSRFNASAAPALGFRLTEKLAVGPGISFAYSSYSLASNSPNVLTTAGDKSISTSSLGFKMFAQYILYNEFFLHAEYEATHAELLGQDAQYYFYKSSRNVTTPLAGIGYRQRFGDHGAADLVALYNFDSSIYSLYPPLVIRFSFLFDIGK